MSINAIAYDSMEHPPVPRRVAWTVFAVLFALMVVDYVDRQVVVSMFPHLKAAWDLSDRQLGALVSIVSIIVALGAVPISLLADRWSRVKSIFLMALVWSSATLACAFAGSYSQLITARGFVGLGEAAYGTVGVALLATLFPLRMRSTVLGAFLAAATLGSVLGVMLGGFIAERWGWQAGFGAVGLPGILLAFLVLLIVRDYKTVALPRADRSVSKPKVSARLIVAELMRPRTALITCLGAGFNLLVVSTVWAWLPSYFNRYYGLAPDHAGAKTALVVLVSGLGAFLWSMLADRLSASSPRARLYVPAVAAMLTTMFMIGVRLGPARSRAIRADRRGWPDDDGQRGSDRRGRDRRHPSRLARDRRLDPVACTQPLRPRGWPAACRRAFRCLRLAGGDVGDSGLLCRGDGDVHSRGAQLPVGSQACGGRRAGGSACARTLRCLTTITRCI